MSALTWDQSGTRVYELGLDRGVLYFSDNTAVAWNGLTSVSEKSGLDRKSYYLDGVKYLEVVTPGDFEASLSAITYPREFEVVNGVAPESHGLLFHDQKPQTFSMCYRTLIGDDLSGSDRGYRIHMLYNLVAVPDDVAYETLSDQNKPVDFSWTLTGTPVISPGHRPTAHFSVDSTRMAPRALKLLEDVLYGTDTTTARLPSIAELVELTASWVTIEIIDNGDGTWTAEVPDVFLTMVSPTQFEISEVDVIYADPNTYTVYTTELEGI